jgi:hypothetical protein
VCFHLCEDGIVREQEFAAEKARVRGPGEREAQEGHNRVTRVRRCTAQADMTWGEQRATSTPSCSSGVTEVKSGLSETRLSCTVELERSGTRILLERGYYADRTRISTTDASHTHFRLAHPIGFHSNRLNSDTLESHNLRKCSTVT